MPAKADYQSQYGGYVYTNGSQGVGYYYVNGSDTVNDYSNNNSINPSPAVYSVTPNSARVEANGNITITLTGANFIPSSIAEWNSSYRPTNYINANHLTMVLNTADLSTTGNYLITVYNQLPGGGLSNGIYFTVAKTLIPNTSGTSSKPKTTAAATTSGASNNTTGTTGTDNNNGLSANALFGSNGFMPSNIFQWLLIFILVLLIVMITRKMTKEKEQNKPLKHA